ncbi:MAG: MtnX-like HAD-IB family phosphatase [Chloroflexi bacterium]|nr:MtnX-like HAD-IB family phosphatase [Chloroflexota bacterium]
MISTGSKVKLRNKSLDDARNDYAWQTDPELAAFDAASLLTVTFTEYISAYASELRNPPFDRRLFAIETMDGKHIGNCVYYNSSERRSETELGIMIGNRDYWSNGYGKDAVNTLLSHIFTRTQFNRVYLKTLTSNERAKKCFQKCGFIPYNEIQRDGYRFVLMEIYRKKWQERKLFQELPGIDPIKAMKTLIQCDFDGTVTVDDISFILLDEFADGNWRAVLEEYRIGRISVGEFNARAFAMVKADKQSLVDMARRRAEVRPGFKDLLDYSKKNDFRFVIVSNGLDFYIETILKDMGLNNAEIFAARTQFAPSGLKVKYLGPDGNEILEGFKDTYSRLFREQGYRVIYIGDGSSDAAPARMAHRIFATGHLTERCRELNVRCMPFNDLNDVVRGLESLNQQEKPE